MKCSFCGIDIGVGRGKMLVAGDGAVTFFCGSKCERNSRIREARRVEWTAAYRKEKALRLGAQKAKKPAVK